MKIMVKENSAIKALSIVDPKSGVDYIADFIGNQGALSDGQFSWDADRDAYVCNKETFDWWSAVVTANQDLDDRIDALTKEHGSEAVCTVIYAVGSVDFEDYAPAANQALDEAFGSAEQTSLPPHADE